MSDRGDNPVVRRNRSSVAMAGLFVLAACVVLYFAAELLIPITFALLLNLLLSPFVRFLARFHIPRTVSAAALMFIIVGTFIFCFAMLAGPAEEWLSEAPKSIRDVKQQIFHSRGKLANIQDLAAEVEELTTTDIPTDTQAVVVQGPGILDSLLGGLPTVAAFAGVVVFLTFFLLASGDTLLRRMTQCGRTWTERRRVVSITREVQAELSRYLSTVTIINFFLGCAVAIMMAVLEVPNPVLWGTMVMLFNFAPYVGALASATVLTLVAITSFDSVAQALIVPGCFLVLTVLEGQIVTPAVLGKRISLSPLFVFLSVIFWGWLWGVAGALMAVPITTSLVVVCAHVPSLNGIAFFVRSSDAVEPPKHQQSLTTASFKTAKVTDTL